MIFNRVTGIIVGIALILIVGIGFLTSLIIKTGLGIKSEIKNQQQELTALTNKKILLANLSKNQSQIQHLYDLSTSALPEKESSTTFLVEMANLVQSNHLTENSFSLTRTAANTTANSQNQNTQTPNKNVKELKYNADLNGNTQDFTNFLSLLEQGARFTTLNNLTYASGETSNKLTINGTLYFKSMLTLDTENQSYWQINNQPKWGLK